jgi:ubiquinone/menaquinone biosynthesis C-methylase UbiE
MTAATQKAHKGAYKGMGMEGSIARWYEKTTRKDMREFRRLADEWKAHLPEGGDVLEVAPGPGFLAIEIARDRRFRVTGLDISKTFVQLAAKNAAEAGVPAQFRQGNAAAMPFADHSFDLLLCRAAFKNFSEPEKAIREMQRVLRPGGTGVIIDLRRDVPMPEIRRYVDRLDLNFISRWFTLLTFRFMLLKRAYTQQEMEKMLRTAPFQETEVTANDIGMVARFQK